MDRFTFHVVGLPHTQTAKTHNGCPFTMKVFNFCKMMHARGHRVYHYGTQGSDCPCAEHVEVQSLAQQAQQFPGNDWTAESADSVFVPGAGHWRPFNDRAAQEALRRGRKGDFVCLIGGACQQPLARLVEAQGLLPVEYSVGYEGSFATHRVFVSYAHMHRRYGIEGRADGNFFDAVIPNFYDPADFPFCPDKGDYLLFMGRLVRRKGLGIAIDVARAIGARLLVCGQGALQAAEGTIVTAEETFTGDRLEFAGFADVRRRAQLMGRARALLAPTHYLEPFGGVNVEAQLCGTPVITTDWGGFTETVLHGVTGYRCRTLEQFIWAADNARQLCPRTIRDRALALYSLDRVAPMYEEYFSMLQTLWDRGWYQQRTRAQLDWLTDPYASGLAPKRSQEVGLAA